MPGCAAIGCTNSSEKGFLMKRFPKDPIRRNEWAIRTKRGNWVPTINSVLCEMHFESHMWEVVRQDGSRRLKCNAVPTIFEVSNIPRRRPMKGTLSDISGTVINDASTSRMKIDNRQPRYPPETVGYTTILNTTIDSKLDREDVDVATFSHPLEVDHSYAKVTSTQDMPVPQSSSEPSKLQNGTTSSLKDRPIFITLTEEQKLDLYEKILKRNRFLLRKYKNKLRSAHTKIKKLKEMVKTLKETSRSEEAKVLPTKFARGQIIIVKKKRKNVMTKSRKCSDET